VRSYLVWKDTLVTPYKLHPIAACLGALLIGLSNETAAAVRRVPSQYPSISAGVQAANQGDTVLVAPGNYTGQGNSSINFTGKAITVCSEAGPDFTAIVPAVDQSAFYFASGEPPAATIKGFTLRDGYRAVWCFESSPTVINCIFFRNGSYDESGGAFFGTNSSPSFIDCDFIENSADGGSGGAIALIYGNLTLTNCTFTRNVAAGFLGNGAIGGAVFYDGRGVDLAAITGCTFADNLATASGGQPPSAGGSGGAMWIASAGIVTDCIFTGNSATTGDPKSSEGYGGAVFGSAAIFARCVFSNNSARLEGGAAKSAGVFESCTFSGNEAGDGGAIATYGSPQFQDCTFSDNRASRGGALTALHTSSLPVFEGCLFLRNQANLGGAIFTNRSVSLRDCTLYQNAASGPAGGGAGLWIGAAQAATVENTIIVASTLGQAITCQAGTIAMSCSDIFGNAGGDYFGCISGLQGVNGNLSADPLFCDASNDDFQLDAASPCAPGNSPAGCDLIGAFPVACGVTGAPSDQVPSIAHELTVIPNPVRGIARFEYEPAGPVETLNIFDASGRLIEQLSKQDDHWEWTPGASVSAGVYFARLKAGGARSAIVKFIYLR
jgi:hypothetical protein